MKSSEVKISVLPSKNIRGIKSIEGPHITSEGEPFTPVLLGNVSLQEAMETSYVSDMFFSCYKIEGLEDTGWPRLSKQSLSSVNAISRVSTAVLAFDWDVPGHAAWDDESFYNFFEKFYAIDDEHLLNWRYAYTSRHGARVVYVLSDYIDVEQAELHLAAMIQKFKICGFEMDGSCCDWTRLFRCPKVLRDGIKTETETYYALDCHENAILDVHGLPKAPKRIVPVCKAVDLPTAAPGPEEIVGYLYSKNSQGQRKNQSQFFKDAKKAMKNIAALTALFQEDVPLAGAGERNDTIMRLLGIAIPLVVKQINYATPKHVYALFYGPVSAMEQTRDWQAHLWNAILTIWPVEVAKYNAEQVAKAEHMQEGLSTIQQIAFGMSKWCAHPDLQDPDKQEAFVMRHLMAMPRDSRQYFYLMQKDGTYSPSSLTKEQLIPKIRTSYLDTIIQTKTIGVKGVMDESATTIVNAHATPIAEVSYVLQPEIAGMIENLGHGGKTEPVLKLPMYRRNPDLEPEYNEMVDEWLAMFFGAEHYNNACLWISYALAFEDGPICALSISGPPGVGKKLLMEGLAETLENPVFATGSDLTGGFNGMLSKTPFVNINESWPKIAAYRSAMDAFKALTAGDKQPVRELYQPLYYVNNPLRLVLTANDHDMIRALLDKDLSPDNKGAFSERFLHCDVTGMASAWLAEKGNLAYTGRLGARWIAGTDGKSDFIVARHFLWLWANRSRDLAHTKGRFLVEGNCGKEGGAFLAAKIVQRDSISVIITAILDIVEMKSQTRKYIIDKTDGSILMTLATIMEQLRVNNVRSMSFAIVSQSMRNLVKRHDTVEIEYKEHHPINPVVLYHYAREEGRDVPNLRTLLSYAMEQDRKNDK